MNRPVVKMGICLLAVSSISACNWGRFTKLGRDTPVERIAPPKNHSSEFALALATAEDGDKLQIMVAGRAQGPGGLVYSLGKTENLDDAPHDKGHCPAESDTGQCRAVVQPAGLNRLVLFGEEHALCFVSGTGEVNGDAGLFVRCEDSTVAALPVPADVEDALLTPDPDNLPRVRLATDDSQSQILVVASQGENRAWYYEPGTTTPIDIPTPGQAGSDFGASVAVLSGSAGTLIAVGAPKDDQVWLFRRTDQGAEPLGCLDGPSGFSRRLAAGSIDADEQGELLVGDDQEISLFSGAELLALPETNSGECVGGNLPDEALIGKLRCSSSGDTGSCEGSGFGDAMVVGDFDGDGRGEVAVGAPMMTAKEKSRAGAVLLFRQPGEAESRILVSNAKEGDAYGASLVSADQGDRDILVVGAPSSAHVYVNYCALGVASAQSVRCQ